MSKPHFTDENTEERKEMGSLGTTNGLPDLFEKRHRQVNRKVDFRARRSGFKPQL